ncbi:Peptidase C39 [Hyella patelloides LEGE 07179]|uniref:Peptidase C39 n=1 Tax=Hyella patelloides LEGE 07179 TaxID=945734 RepID=A0A563VYH4_9CYAN|nr:peptidase domain-containing ABC transporter [Hyella patelloides]VEP16466.1 Peptidase C39 [Hyella patelloides LEGE 07179]
MTATTFSLTKFIEEIQPFNTLPESALTQLGEQLEPVRYLLGEKLLLPKRISTHVLIICRGKVRFLGYDVCREKVVTLEKLESKSLVGASSLVREVYNETAIASTDVDCLALPREIFESLLEKHHNFAAYFRNQISLIEIFEVLGAALNRQADGTTDLKQLAIQAQSQAIVRYFPPDKPTELDPNYQWYVSGGKLPAEIEVNSYFNPEQCKLSRRSSSIRLLGIPESILAQTDSAFPVPVSRQTIEFNPASQAITSPEFLPTIKEGKANKYPFFRGKGTVKEALACFQMLCDYFQVKYRKDIVQRVVNNQAKTGAIDLNFCGAVTDLLGLQVQQITIPVAKIPSIPTPALIAYEDSFAVIYHTSATEVVLGIPSRGIKHRRLDTFADIWGKSGQILLLQPKADTPKQKFGLSWFFPAIIRYRRVLIEVLIASFFVQLFGLVNPLMTQVIIDQVIGGNSLDTLHVFGVLMVIVALFEALLSSLRTHLFADTTNRIDMGLASQVIDRLVRLPMGYFGKRTTGELATRVQELEKIRSFLTGTALTVVLDVVFSVIYIGVMVFYSPLLTATALSVVPLLIILTAIFSPILRRLLRQKAIRHAATQSYLVEVLNGIETVKSQNIELKTRMAWQERYGHFISAGFKAVKLSAVNSSLNSFLNKLSTLLVLWVGAYLVLQSKLTLGELIAFRIIAGYVTNPLMRLSQLWQQFLETALSIERLGDILNHTEESPPEQQRNLPMPPVTGAVTYEDISFSFAGKGSLQLKQVNLEIEAGSFVGIVGESGSGKSTLMKLLPRFYNPMSGRILIDGYDIAKVELYSLRRQLGIVPQNPLLFDGTVYENIALNSPDASVEAITEAAQIAAAHDFIMSLPEGYNTPVGERGSTLSGGQRQRIAIARAVLQNPRLLILDEATSALDYDTEQRVCRNLARRFQGRTVFFITHRLSTIRDADLILMMTNGVIEERGRHQELIALQGRYSCLYQ